MVYIIGASNRAIPPFQRTEVRMRKFFDSGGPNTPHTVSEWSRVGADDSGGSGGLETIAIGHDADAGDV